jgi:hypothetical protein
VSSLLLRNSQRLLSRDAEGIRVATPGPIISRALPRYCFDQPDRSGARDCEMSRYGKVAVSEIALANSVMCRRGHLGHDVPAKFSISHLLYRYENATKLMSSNEYKFEKNSWTWNCREAKVAGKELRQHK